MKRMTIMLAILLSLALLASCEEAQSHGSLRISLENDPRSIVPAEYPLETASYRILGSGPSGATLDMETSKTSVTVEGLAVGEWNLEARALNENGDELVRGETTAHLTGRTNSATIILDELIGKGSITLNLSWNVDILSTDPTIEVELAPEYGSDEVEQLERTSFNAAAGTATYSGSDYPSGSYRVSARLYEKSVLLAGFTEAVRVAGDQDSEGNIEFDLDKYPTEPAVIELVNMTGVPVTLSITGITDTVTADVPLSVSLESDSDDISTFQITWHLNGEQIGTGETISFTPTVGVHRLDAVASTSRTGSSGSASFNFEAVSASETGSPNQGNIVTAASSGINMGRGMVVEFLPDGNVMIASNTERTVQICSIVRSTLSVEKTYSYDSLGIASGQQIADFAAGEKTTAEHKIFMLFNSPLNAAVYNYSPTAMTMTHAVSGMTDSDMNFNGNTYAPSKAHFAGINVSRDVGIAILSDDTGNRFSSFLFTLSAESSSAFKDTNSNNNFGAMFKEDPIRYFTYDDDAYFAGGGSLYAGHADTEATTPYALSISLMLGQDAFTNTTGIAMLGPEHLIVTGDDATIMSDQGFWKVASSEPLGFVAAGVTASPDKRYLYMIDTTSDELVSYRIVNEGERIEEIASTPVKGDGLDELRISESGHSLLLFNSATCDAITVMSINR